MTEMTTHPTPLKPTATASDAGEAWWWLGSLAVIKATATDTGGQMTIVEMTEAPGTEAPLHVHHREDEAFWVLEGTVTFEVGDTTIQAGPDDYAFGPRDIPHRYTVGPDGCRMLFIFTPGGFEETIRKMSEPAAARTVPPAADARPEIDYSLLEKFIAEAGCELLG
jgi:quercetin dioxygenase-like cupin family protein